MKLRTCSSCDREMLLAAFRLTSSGPGFKTCNKCRERKKASLDAIREERRKPHPRRTPGKPCTACADCSKALTPNRAISLGGQYLCMPCRAKRFGK